MESMGDESAFLHQDKARTLDFERITFLYTNFSLGFIGFLASVLFMGAAVHQLYSTKVAIIWASVVLITYLPRIVLSIRFSRKLKNNEITPSNIRPWELYGIVFSIAPFVAFSTIIFFPYQEHTQIALLLCTIYVVLLVAGGALAYSTSIGILLVFVHVTFIALIVRCFWEGRFRAHGTRHLARHRLHLADEAHPACAQGYDRKHLAEARQSTSVFH